MEFSGPVKNEKHTEGRGNRKPTFRKRKGNGNHNLGMVEEMRTKILAVKNEGPGRS